MTTALHAPTVFDADVLDPAAHADLVPASPAPMTPEEFEHFDDGRLYELIDGIPVEKNVSAYADAVANQTKDVLFLWAHPIGAGKSYVEATFQCFPDAPGTVRRPDVAFINAERVGAYSWDDPHIRLVPDLVVEVLSPNDSWYDVEDKIAEFHRAGVPLVCVANPNTRTLFVHPNGGKPRLLSADDELDGGDVLPGFRCRVGELFPDC